MSQSIAERPPESAPFQPAIAAGLALPAQFYRDVAAGLQANRDQLCAALSAAGFACSGRPAHTS